MRSCSRLWAIGIACLVGASAVAAAAEPAPKVTRVIQTIELATKKGAPFRGRVVLRAVSSSPGGESPKPEGGERAEADAKLPPISYYWGGKCKDTDIPPSRLQLLTEAMDEGWVVEVQAFPIEYQRSVVMCMQGFSVSKR